MGLWPGKGQEHNPGKWFYFRQWLITISTMTLILGTIHQLIISSGIPDYNVGVAISLCGIYYFNFSFSIQIKNLSRIFVKLSKFDHYGKPEHFDEDNSRLNKLSSYHYIYIFVLGAGFSLTPYHRTNTVELTHTLLKIVTKQEDPFDRNGFTAQLLSFLLTFYSTMYSYFASSTISFAIMESMEHIIIRLKHVQTMFTRALDDNMDLNYRRNFLKDCVSYHNIVIKWAENLDSYFNACMFVHVLLTGAILGVLAHAFIKGVAILNSAILLYGWFLSILMVASAGEKLVTESVGIGEIIAQTNWYRLETECKKSLTPVLIRSQKPVYLHAGPFGILTYKTILTILKTAYSYLTLMSSYH